MRTSEGHAYGEPVNLKNSTDFFLLIYEWMQTEMLVYQAFLDLRIHGDAINLGS